MNQGRRQRQTLLPSAGELTAPSIKVVLHTDQLDHLSLAGAKPVPAKAVHAAEKLQVLLRREVAVEAERLVHVADRALDGLRFLHDVVAVYGGGAGGWQEQAA